MYRFPALLRAISPAMLLSALSLAAPLDPANVNVSFIVNQSGNPAFGLVSDPIYASNSVASTLSDPYTYSGSAWASFGALGAASSFSDANRPVPSHGLLSIARFVDQLYVSAPGSTATTYRLTPTIRLTGSASWSANTPPPNAPFAVAVANSQAVKRESDTNYAATSTPDFYPGNGDDVDATFALPTINIPANELFNYRFTFIVNARVFSSGGYEVTSAEGDFLGTIRVVGLSLTDETGTPLDFNVRSGSGALYTPNGISAVPEPGAFGLSATGALLLALRLWRRRRG